MPQKYSLSKSHYSAGSHHKSVTKSVFSCDYGDETTTCLSYNSKPSFKASKYKTSTPFFVKKSEKGLTVPEGPQLGLPLKIQNFIVEKNPIQTEPAEDKFDFL